MPWIGALLLIVCGAPSIAADGARLYAPCAACHGNKGEGNTTLNSPAIAGQDAAYLERQLRNFRGDRRGTHKSDVFGAQMRAFAATLADDAAIAKVAGFVASLPKTASVPAANANLRNGNNLYHGKCGACHGNKAEGNPALNSPRLAGLDAAYLKRQFAYFRDGVRGTNQKDLPGRQMALMAKTMPNERDLDDVIAFIQQQGRGK
jgi:cytochrome c oxidase subunit 2